MDFNKYVDKLFKENQIMREVLNSIYNDANFDDTKNYTSKWLKETNQALLKLNEGKYE